MRSERLIAMLSAVLVVTATVMFAEEAKAPPVAQDPEVLRFAERVLPWYPDSLFSVTEDAREMTPSGSYRRVAVLRDAPSKFMSGTTTFFIDEVAKTIWVGTPAQLPFQDTGIKPGGLRGFIEEFLPKALESSTRMKTRIDWDTGGVASGALIPFTLQVDTGYGDYPRSAAVSSDGAYLMLGTPYPLGSDPVAFRRDLLHTSDVVMWDRPGTDAAVEVVEFSDLECPACRNKWPLLHSALKKHPDTLHHGMVSFPLTTIHPWAFRGASASWCVAAQAPDKLTSFKELFYSLQRDMEVSQVTPTSLDFVEGDGLNVEAFKSCYLKQPSLEAVHRQIALAARFGVMSTPTYFVNGWMIQAPESNWFPDFMDRIAAGTGP
jgi:protein-disulfide isomerase